MYLILLPLILTLTCANILTNTTIEIGFVTLYQSNINLVDKTFTITFKKEFNVLNYNFYYGISSYSSNSFDSQNIYISWSRNITTSTHLGVALGNTFVVHLAVSYMVTGPEWFNTATYNSFIFINLQASTTIDANLTNGTGYRYQLVQYQTNPTFYSSSTTTALPFVNGFNLQSTTQYSLKITYNGKSNTPNMLQFLIETDSDCMINSLYASILIYDSVEVQKLGFRLITGQMIIYNQNSLVTHFSHIVQCTTESQYLFGVRGFLGVTVLNPKINWIIQNITGDSQQLLMIKTNLTAIYYSYLQIQFTNSTCTPIYSTPTLPTTQSTPTTNYTIFIALGVILGVIIVVLVVLIVARSLKRKQKIVNLASKLENKNFSMTQMPSLDI